MTCPWRQNKKMKETIDVFSCPSLALENEFKLPGAFRAQEDLGTHLKRVIFSLIVCLQVIKPSSVPPTFEKEQQEKQKDNRAIQNRSLKFGLRVSVGPFRLLDVTKAGPDPIKLFSASIYATL